MKPFMLYPADDKRRYWICCTLEREGYELPKMEKISLNSVQARQMETFSEKVHFDSDGDPELVCELTSSSCAGIALFCRNHRHPCWFVQLRGV
jgi:hypothetical protein